MQSAAWLHLGNRAANEVSYVSQNVSYELPWYECLGVSASWPDLAKGVLAPPLTRLTLPRDGVLEVEVSDVDFGALQGTVTAGSQAGAPSSTGDRGISLLLTDDPFWPRKGQQVPACKRKRTALSFSWTCEVRAGQQLAIVALHDAGDTPIQVAGNDLWLKYWEVTP